MFNKVWYDRMKFVAQILLPGLGSLYFGLAGIWHLPYADQIVGTVVVLDTFLGVILGISMINYNRSDEKYAGIIEVSEDEDNVRYLAGVRDGVDNLSEKKEALFKVELVNDPHTGRHEAR
jgi:hypothetical protein